MRGLTLTQPYASLVALGAKRIETRSWGTSYRGPLAIHAAVGLGSVGGKAGLRVLCAANPFFDALGLTEMDDPTRRLPFGAVVAVARVANVVRMEDRPWGVHAPGYAVSMYDLAFGHWAPGRYAWILEDVERLPVPVPCRGALGLWNVPAGILA